MQRCQSKKCEILNRNIIKKRQAKNQDLVQKVFKSWFSFSQIALGTFYCLNKIRQTTTLQ